MPYLIIFDLRNDYFGYTMYNENKRQIDVVAFSLENIVEP